jgi:myo-inositol-1(or 4)-monophosphatase
LTLQAKRPQASPVASPEKPSFDVLLATAHALADRAGAVILPHFRTGFVIDHKGGDLFDPVTAADRTAEMAIREALAEVYPSHGIVGEEYGALRADADYCWVVDPIDGTRAFLEGVPHFCHAAALVENGTPVLAVLFNPVEDRFYEAVANKGARLNGALIRVSHRQQIAGCRMAAFGPMFKHPAWPQPWPEMEIIQRDSVAWRLALVASGDADAAMGLNTKNDWDLAAADLMVREAGGVMTAHDGKTLSFNNPVPQQPSFMAAGPSLHAALLARTVDIKLRRRTTP